MKNLDEINKLLLVNAKENHVLGLLNGKLGLTIYFYHFAKKNKNHKLQELADHLVGEIFEKSREARLEADFENGLAGIAFGITYLVNNDFVDADLNETLSELDDRIFRFLDDQRTNLQANLRNGILGYLIYSLDRLKSSIESGNNSNIYIFKNLTASLINQLGKLIEEEKIQDREPQLFNIYWDLPLSLIVLGRAKNLKVNDSKIDRIIDYLIPNLITLFPSLHSNRLYLLLGIETYLKETDCPELRKYADFLIREIDLELILNTELKNLNISVNDGLTGLSLISNRLNEIKGNKELLISDEKVYQKAIELEKGGRNEFYDKFKESIGFASGLTGLAWAIFEIMELNEKSLKVI
ncbi:glycoside hydrolase family protein [Algoriphagus pacificus]|uniref:Lanthionine synthetase C-like protein n=1 Tax=Algoriphagus pacificus TaxID=2811234 RepID=A0ABS3CC71_9BACT|nr:hypothetical protein [Algoriphagus pacificus]MBN7814703.1 hypothetical protein [Algoriphagus pacificus]